MSVGSGALRSFGRSRSFRPSEARAGIHSHRMKGVNKQYFVYILANRKHARFTLELQTTLFDAVTSTS